jgi:hypothetical protein
MKRDIMVVSVERIFRAEHHGVSVADGPEKDLSDIGM